MSEEKKIYKENKGTGTESGAKGALPCHVVRDLLPLYIDGLTAEQLAAVMELKNVKRGEFAELKMAGTKFAAKKNPWQTVSKYDCAFPCSRQNELDGKDAEYMLKHGVTLVGEGANMPCTPEAANAFISKRILYSPGKASNAGGVAT